MTTEPDDDEIVTWWGLVIEGYLATQERLMGEIAERFDLPPASFDILVRLVRSPDNRLPMTRLAKEAALSSGGFTKVADRLVAAGLIERVPSAEDRRVTYARLTDHGLDVASNARKACADILRERVLTPLGHHSSEALAEAMRTLRSVNGTKAE
ncbi:MULTISPECIES: MarR family winged helix-turn-helix transcriptional regulator [Prauserella salsuginis group]|uniref:MarR family winged helix-turn-helix transcriptional regulator n=1 Tax=Prauserella salsuginis TaxID=387889 RepID=A0ABW6G736_9PSEU|nr:MULTISPECIES: MarR family transcriptional regulator [Prauserella salsuginis group]MCR3720796.1 DNA-binding transcriptional regulator, MarR family [Prauserella flava]MCR3735123.1 DNA-binding transcriptional regulator, MarR family [Prauserella salsuginis]